MRNGTTLSNIYSGSSDYFLTTIMTAKGFTLSPVGTIT